MIAYKFLGEGRVAPFSGLTWPDPGEWLEVETVNPCRARVHACRIAQLPYWLRPELWEVELDGELVEGELMLVAPRGRLVHRVEAWNRNTERQFGEACAAEARRRVERAGSPVGFVNSVRGPEVSTRP